MPCSLLAHVEAARGATTQAAGAALVAEAGGGSGQTDAGGSRVPHVVASSADLDTAEMAAVRKEAETKLVAITWLACCLWVRPSARASPWPCALWRGCQPSRGRAFESERRLGRPNAVRTKRRARARSQAAGGRPGRMGAHEHARAAATVIWRGERR